MLKELGITNFAIIDRLSLGFQEGLNVLSGETGAGKSILIGAIGLLLGDRASTDLIRSEEDAAVVEAVFDIGASPALKARLQEMGFHPGREIVVKRVVSRSGKNRVYVDGNLATVAMLGEISEALVNICSQHEHQVLLDPESHIDILDEFGNLTAERLRFSALYDEFQKLRQKRDDLAAKNRNRAEREEFLRFQIGEIEKTAPRPGEDAALQEERRILANAAKLAELARDSWEALYGSEESVLGALARVAARIRDIRRIDPGFAVSEDEMKSLTILVEDAARALRDYLGKIPSDPSRLEEVEDRLEALGRLKKKYGGSIEGVLETAQSLRAELQGLASAAGDIEALEQELADRKTALRERAAGLSAARRRTAETLEKAIEGEIRDLKMEKARFSVRFREPALDEDGLAALNPKGIDQPEFHLSTNVGEPLKPLNRVASGGELSRIVLAMKKVLARAGSVGTVVFDEVDSGIGGATAEIVGRKLRDISRHHQVICITHLPQIASFGRTHYRVTKRVSDGRTKTDVRQLSEDERVEEITRMLGGVEITDRTRAAAREMLKAAKK
ncbi:MAG: DNA repair protein RecN [Syntrophaceae bacterium PtaB.Bin038]|nr:MAG: DNA repair protein RecN [Syntrophaceae bacterium PtaB.Bin038]